MSSAAEDQGWKPRTDAQRLASKRPLFCSTCNEWGDHFADFHENTGPVATIEERAGRWCSICGSWTGHTSRNHESAIEAQGETG